MQEDFKVDLTICDQVNSSTLFFVEVFSGDVLVMCLEASQRCTKSTNRLKSIAWETHVTETCKNAPLTALLFAKLRNRTQHTTNKLEVLRTCDFARFDLGKTLQFPIAFCWPFLVFHVKKQVPAFCRLYAKFKHHIHSNSSASCGTLLPIPHDNSCTEREMPVKWVINICAFCRGIYWWKFAVTTNFAIWFEGIWVSEKL